MRTGATSPKGNNRCLMAATGLKRLPGDFSWQVLRSLFRELSTLQSPASAKELEQILRKGDPHEYHAYAAKASLQRMGELDAETQPFEVCVSRLWSCVGKKSRDLETVGPRERASAAIHLSLDLDHFRDFGFLDTRVGKIAKREIAELLPCLDLDDVIKHARHGPGATVDPRIGRDTYSKYGSWPYSVSPKALDPLTYTIRSDPRWLGVCEDAYRREVGASYWSILPSDWFGELVKPVPYNRIVTVPKDGTKDRSIAIEPIGNVYLQLGVDGVIRRALKRWGIDLNDQQPNQEGAALGSANHKHCDGLATLDLSSASDRVSQSIVRGLLPEPWWELLDRLRSPYGLLPDGTAWRYARMSSMGNGYTFALETLVFAAILRAIVQVYGLRRDLSNLRVFGDDCEYPSYLDKHVKVYFTAAGFIVNASKSFAAPHPVRESCGKEYWRGHDITPVRFPPSWDCAETLLAFRNNLAKWSLRCLGTMDYVKASLAFCDSYLAVLPDYGPPSDAHESEYRFEDRAAPWALTLKVLSRHRKAVRPPEFMFGKLMHSLKSCDSDRGTRFDVNRTKAGTVTLVEKTVVLGNTQGS